ncbi:MAG: bacillithiol system redox-active protein YtxJ [Vicinamibacteria bacterium]
MKLLTRNEEIDEVLRRPLAIVFKHSTLCSMSSLAHREAEKFLEAHPEAEVHKVNVIESRAISDYIEKLTGVRHESPQLLVFRGGEVVWHESHFGVTARAIAEAID